MSDPATWEKEADCLARYLVGRPAGTPEKQAYAEAMGKIDIVLTPQEAALWPKMLRSKFWLAGVDGGLALLQPTSPLRRKIFVMLAILEASPAYTAYFLSRDFSPFYLLKVGWAAVRGGARGLIGILLVKAAGVR